MKNKQIKYLILIISCALMSIGIIKGEHMVVLRKAINICLECIGIG